MPEEFLTIKEAADRYGKAPITIRRLVREIEQQRAGERRQFVQPDASTVDELKQQGKPFTYTVSTRLLNNEYVSESTDREEKSQTPATSAESEIVAILKQTNQSLNQQLTVKDEQIKSLNQTLDAINERQREANVLMRGLQERLPIPAETASRQIHTATRSDMKKADANTPEPSSVSEQGSTLPAKRRSQPSRKKSTRLSLWSRLRGKHA